MKRSAEEVGIAYALRSWAKGQGLTLPSAKLLWIFKESPACTGSATVTVNVFRRECILFPVVRTPAPAAAGPSGIA